MYGVTIHLDEEKTEHLLQILLQYLAFVRLFGTENESEADFAIKVSKMLKNKESGEIDA